jgi:hypothetical protein
MFLFPRYLINLKAEEQKVKQEYSVGIGLFHSDEIMREPPPRAKSPAWLAYRYTEMPTISGSHADSSA